MKGYYFITDSKLSRAGNFNDVMQAAACKVEVVQYRNKNAETLEMYEEALHLREICRDLTFLINDRIDIALAVGADGVHGVGAADERELGGGVERVRRGHGQLGGEGGCGT